jgi:uncharacterized membrane protein YhiD involved in acid resistance
VNPFDFEDLTGTFAAGDVILTLLVSLAASVVLGFVYRATHSGISYSKTFVQSLVILGMTVSVVMLVVGSNIARAFSLVGALSIVRFRNAVKETRDVAFVFLVMVVGMAAGTRFYLLAGIAAMVIGLVILAMDRFDLFENNDASQILRVQAGPDAQAQLEEVLLAHTSRAELLSIDTVRGDLGAELVYSVQLRKRSDPQELLLAIRDRVGDSRVSLVTGYDTTAI